MSTHSIFGAIFGVILMTAAADSDPLPQQFIDLWMGASPDKERSCSKTDDKDIENYDGFVRITSAEWKEWEAICGIRKVTKATQSEEGSNAVVELACTGEGQKWRKRELWATRVLSGRKYLMKFELTQWDAREQDGRLIKRNDRSQPSVGQVYAECNGRSLKYAKARNLTVEARTRLRFRTDGSLDEIAHEWTFDRPFSEFATKELKPGQRTRADLQPLADVSMTSLEPYLYFTALKAIDGTSPKLAVSDDYYLTEENGLLTLHFKLKPEQAKPISSIEMADKADAAVSFRPAASGWLRLQTAGEMACGNEINSEAHDLKARVWCSQ